MTILLHSLDDYVVLTIIFFIKIHRKKEDHETINEFKYIILAHVHITFYLLYI
jgi:hypothetical protein